MKKHEIILLRIAVAVLAALMIIGIILVSNNEAAAAIEPEAPMPEIRTKIEYRTIEVPVEIPTEPVYVTQYIEEESRSENRFSALEISDEDIELMARLVYHEARGECAAGQRMVAEVVLNRALTGGYFPGNVHDVIYQHYTDTEGKTTWQFSPAPLLATTTPTEAQYAAVRAALYESPITDEDVVYFSRAAYNDRIYCRIGCHTFCRI